VSQIEQAFAQAVVEAALERPYLYLPDVNWTIAQAHQLALGLIMWARGQGQPLLVLADGDALKAAATAVDLKQAGEGLTRDDHEFFAVVHGFIREQLLKHEDATSKYRCSKCGRAGYKLWRQYNTFLDHIRLLCAACAEETEGEMLDLTQQSQIGNLVPAIPTVDLESYWGSASAPGEARLWWNRLRTRPCRRCGDTGIWETGNNDLPCDCEAGVAAALNVSSNSGYALRIGR